MSNYVKATNFATKDTLPTGDSNKIVKGTEIDNEFNAISGAISSKADISSPALTGTPTAPTAVLNSNTTQLATTAFVRGEIVDERTVTTTITNKTINLGSNTVSGTVAQFNTALSDGDFATLNGTETLTNKTLTSPTINTPTVSSPTMTGIPVAPTASAGTNTTQIATTAFVTTALQAAYPVGSIYMNATNSQNPATLLGFGTWVSFGAGRMPVGFNGSDPLFDSAEETGGSKDSIVVSHTHTATTSITDPGHSHYVGSNDSTANDGGAPLQEFVRDWNAGNGAKAYTNTVTTGITASTSIASTGSSGTNANLPPYIVVYMWKRTA